jgi:hypothetical protein
VNRWQVCEITDRGPLPWLVAYMEARGVLAGRRPRCVLPPDRGLKTSNRCDTDLILAALEYGIWSRDVRDGQLIHHSDGPRTTRRSGSRNAYGTAELAVTT